MWNTRGIKEKGQININIEVESFIYKKKHFQNRALKLYYFPNYFSAIYTIV